MDTQIVTWGVAVIGALVGVVRYLYKRIEILRDSDMEKLEKSRQEDLAHIETKLDHCEEKHESMNTQMLVMTEKIGNLEGQHQGRSETLKDMHEAIGKMADRIVQEIKK